MSGTLSDFDYYNPAHLEKFGEFIKQTKFRFSPSAARISSSE
jgi:hypothetical protein